MKKIVIFCFLIFTIIIIGCSTERYHPLENAKGSNVKETVIMQPTGIDSYEKIIKATGSSSHLFFGKYEDEYTVRTLLKFENFPDDSAIIQKAHIILYSQDVLGDTTVDAFTANLYEFTIDWDDGDTLLWNDLNPATGKLLSSALINPSTKDSIIFELETGTVDQWMDTSLVNYGVFIDCEGASFIKDVYAYESSTTETLPYLRLEYSTPAHQDTSYLFNSYPTNDMFVIEDFTDSILDTNLLYIGRGIAYRSTMKFDIDSLIERKDTINKAVLHLVINENYSMFDASGAAYLQVSDTSFSISGTSLSISSENVTIDVTDLVRFWAYLEDSFPNYRLLAFSSSESSYLDRIAFYSSTADSINVPKLEIVYTIPPNEDSY